MTKHIIMYSGGTGSWATAKLITEKYGKENVVLVFADTLIEDEDLYRFVNETAAKLDVELVHLKDGRDVWEVFKDDRFLGNSRLANCSKFLKQKPSREWLEANYKPDECIVYVGIDWSETHRLPAIEKGYLPYTAKAPLTEPPYLDKAQVLAMLEADGIKPPRLYAMGFAHNNCGGFCVRAGQAQFKKLLEHFPERFDYHAQKEQELREYLDKDVTILRYQEDKKKYLLPLVDLKKKVQSNCAIDEDDWGGCGCFIDDPDASKDDINE